MSKKILQNTAASIRQKLFNYSKTNHRRFDEVLTNYAIERFLYRLSSSQYSDKYVLKGALLLRIWNSTYSRPTKDIDLLGKTKNSERNIIFQFKKILSTPVEEDGIIFDANSISTKKIKETSSYQGIRVFFTGFLDRAKIRMQIDIAFDDKVFPSPKKEFFPTLLQASSPLLLSYSRESVIAEKFEAMITLGDLNSRMKDFYDIWSLSKQFSFQGKTLVEAIKLTLHQRNIELSKLEISAFTDTFAQAKQIQWVAFRRRIQEQHIPEAFIQIIRQIKIFLSLPIQYFISGNECNFQWDLSGTWK